MNIFEKYGSYEAVKQAALNYKNSGDMVTAAGLELQCLEYRRQHNIFEEFDMLVYMEISNISKIYRMVSVKPNSEGYIWMMGKGGLVYENIKYLTHANDEEIAAGKRL